MYSKQYHFVVEWSSHNSTIRLLRVAHVSFRDSEQKKGAFPVMLVNTLSFKDDLDLTNRLEIALEYLKQGGFYGVVTDLANAYNTNRQRVYDILDRVLLAFYPPKGIS